MALHHLRTAPLINTMYYVYLIRSYKTGKFYVGLTNNLERRLHEHNEGLNQSTKGRGPYEVFYYEAFKCKEDAEARENGLKVRPNSLTKLKNRLKVSLITASSRAEVV